MTRACRPPRGPFWISAGRTRGALAGSVRGEDAAREGRRPGRGHVRGGRPSVSCARSLGLFLVGEGTGRRGPHAARGSLVLLEMVNLGRGVGGFTLWKCGRRFLDRS